MDAHARPLETDDLAVLADIDREYAREFGVEARVGDGSLRFFARSGHAFVAIHRGAVRGFVLAQAVFDGERPTVVVSRLASPPPGDAVALTALVRALTKSAYDAGVYDLRADLPATDAAGAQALHAEAFSRDDVAVFGRKLGSRAATTPAVGVGDGRA